MFGYFYINTGVLYAYSVYIVYIDMRWHTLRNNYALNVIFSVFGMLWKLKVYNKC